MADYYNYNNISLKVNGSGILANSASLSFSTNLPNLPASIALAGITI